MTRIVLDGRVEPPSISSQRKKIESVNVAKRKPNIEPPTVVTFVACDGVSTDPGTGKTSIYGIFDRIQTNKFPIRMTPFKFYVRLKGGKGKQLISFSGLSPAGEKVGEGSRVEIPFQSGATYDVNILVSDILIKRPGVYRFFVRSGRRKIGQPYELTVTKIRTAKK